MKQIFIILSIFVIATFGLPSEDISGIQNEAKLDIQDIIPSITNGTRATLGQFPYQVAITMNMGSGLAVCGGTLIKHRWVLTAAHCLLPIYTNFRVAFATLNALSNVHEWRSAIIPSDNFRIHPDFNFTQLLNNIALINVDSMPDTLTNSPNVGIIDMPNEAEANLNLVGRVGTTSGYGRTTDGVAQWDPILYYTTHNIVSNDICRRVFGNFTTNNNLCVDTETGGSPCGSDAGGPLTIQSGSRTILVGVVSATPEFCTIGNPGFYESINAHRDWIDRTINGSSMIGVSFALVGAVIMMAFKNFF